MYTKKAGSDWYLPAGGVSACLGTDPEWARCEGDGGVIKLNEGEFVDMRGRLDCVPQKDIVKS